MSFNMCPSCGENVISMKEKCPKCGVVPEKSFSPFIAGAIIIFALAILAVLGVILF